MIHRLLNHLLFAFTFFAAAAPAIASGTGAGDTGASPGGNDAGKGTDAGSGAAIPSGDGAGDKRTTDTRTADADGKTEIETGEDDFGSFDEDFGGEESQSRAEISHDEFGPETYKAVKEALKAQPEVFKAVKKAVGMVKRYQEHFDTPEAAGELLGDIQSLGGWDTVKQDVIETATFLNGYNAGDKAVVSKWLDDNPDGLLKNMPLIQERWRTLDESGWAHDAAQTFKATLLNPNEQTGLSPVAALKMLGQIEGVKDSDAYKTIMQRVNGVIAKADEVPQKKEQVRTDDPKLTAREQQVKQQEASLRKQSLGGKAQPVLDKEAKGALQLVAGSKKLSERARTDITNDMHSEFSRLVKKMDPDGVEKRRRLLAAGQDEQWLKMVKSAASRFMPMAARNVWRKYAGIAGVSAQEKQERRAEGHQRRESGTGGQAQGVQQLANKPDGSDVDWSAMAAKFGGKSQAEDAFNGWDKKFPGKRLWIQKKTGILYAR